MNYCHFPIWQNSGISWLEKQKTHTKPFPAFTGEGSFV